LANALTAFCSAAVRLLPNQPEVLDSRALAYWLQGDQDRARRDLEEARRLDPAVPDWQTRFKEFESLY